MQFLTTPRARTLLVGLTGVIVVITLGLIMYHSAVTPRLDLHAPTGSKVSIYDIATGKTMRQTMTSTTLTDWLASSSYVVTIQTNTGAQQFYTTLSPFHSVSFTLKAHMTDSQLIAPQASYGVAVQNGSYVYFNPVSEALESRTASGTPQALAPSLSSSYDQTIAQNCPMCLSSPQAIGLIDHNQMITEFNNTFFLMQHQQFTPLSTVGLPDQSTWQTSAIGANEHQDSFVVAINQTLYLYQSPDSNPIQIATLPKQFDQLVYGGNKVIAYSTRMPYAREDIRASYGGYAISPIVFDMSTKQQTTPVNGPIIDASLSPDGQRATFQTQGRSMIDLYNLTSATRLASFPRQGTTTPIWQDNTHYIYSAGSQIWQMDSTSLTATAIANARNNQPIASLSFDQEHHLYYATTFDGQNGAIFAVAEVGQ